MRREHTSCCCCGSVRRFARMRPGIVRVRPHYRCVQVDYLRLVSLREGRNEVMLVLIVRDIERPYYEATIN